MFLQFTLHDVLINVIIVLSNYFIYIYISISTHTIYLVILCQSPVSELYYGVPQCLVSRQDRENNGGGVPAPEEGVWHLVAKVYHLVARMWHLIARERHILEMAWQPTERVLQAAG
jgi:hypothetical protein